MSNVRISGKARAGILAFLAVTVSVYALAQVSPVIRKAPERAFDPVVVLRGRVDELEKLTKDLAQKLKKSEDQAAAMQKSITDLLGRDRPPKGFTTMFLTKANFDKVEDSALMKFFVKL